MFGFSAEEKLREAIIDGNVANAEKILSSQKIDLNKKDKDGLTLLMLAVKEGNTECMRLLVDKGADTSIATSSWGDTALHLAASYRHLSAVEILLGANADINSKNAHGYTPLIYAILGKNEEIVRLLINKGASIKEKDAQQRTPLFWAASTGPQKIANLLLSGDPDIDARDAFYGDTALIHAIRCGHSDVAQQLIEKGANAGLENSSKSTALIEAAHRGNYDIVKLLIDKGVPLDTQDQFGFSALLQAINQGHSSVAELLIDKGASTTLVNQYGENALELAKRRPLHGVIRKIKEIPNPIKEVCAETSESWTRLGKDKIAHIGIYPEIQKKITNIFNFTTREQIVISENLALQSEAVSPVQSFDTVSEESLRQAFNAFIEQGGKADEAKVFRYTRLDKPPSPPPGK